MNIKEYALEQLAVDFGTTAQALEGGKNLFTVKENDPRKRAYENGTAALNLLCLDGIAVFSVQGDELRAALEEQFREQDAAWLMGPKYLQRLEKVLNRFGQTIADHHLYYLPRPDLKAPSLPDGWELQWLEGDALTPYQDDDRFDEALAGNPAWPDRIAAAAVRNGEILAMAGASEDSKCLWQLGINTLPAARGQGLGSTLVGILAARVLREGRVPFYATAFSHILSQKVAAHAGFLPAWAELYTKPIE